MELRQTRNMTAQLWESVLKVTCTSKILNIKRDIDCIISQSESGVDFALSQHIIDNVEDLLDNYKIFSNN